MESRDKDIQRIFQSFQQNVSNIPCLQFNLIDKKMLRSTTNGQVVMPHFHPVLSQFTLHK